MCLNNRKSLAELKTDDYVEHILQLLKQVHAMFFVHKLPNNNNFGKDVRHIFLLESIIFGKWQRNWGQLVQLEGMNHQSPMWLQQILERKNSLPAVKNKKLLVRREWVES
ncbi:RNA polymerase II C-terminal domain phosphatase-like 4 [Rosa sericea]